ncbi:hypothetical protein P154DRAFT_491724 [Amniculicola lignicola CBS 123094]|uniref:NYN domain-containing protein n=1 Tax=Amniculicola lignicola CBS 123094 TaxID=1392246 RepID=A0A6A5WF80_9PLEO|nr:hypothetical protein P154DRAFT_491724 [Amniculicola lignicola CBS 123094]
MPLEVTDTSWGFSPVLLALNADYNEEQDGDLALLTDGAGDDRFPTTFSVSKSQQALASRLGDFSKIWGDLGIPDTPLASPSSVSPATPALEFLSPLDSDATIAPENPSDIDDVFSYPPLQPTNRPPWVDDACDVQQRFLSTEVHIVDQNSRASPTCSSKPTVRQSPTAKREGDPIIDQAGDAEAESPGKKKKKNKKERRKSKKAAQEGQHAQSEGELPYASRVSNDVLNLVPNSVQQLRQPSPSRNCAPRKILRRPSEPLRRAPAMQTMANVHLHALSNQPPNPMQGLHHPGEAPAQAQTQSPDPANSLLAINTMFNAPVRPTLAQQLYPAYNPSLANPPHNQGAVATLQASLKDQFTRVGPLDPHSSYDPASLYGPVLSYDTVPLYSQGPVVGRFTSPHVATPQPVHVQGSYGVDSQATQLMSNTPVPSRLQLSLPVRSREDRHFDLLKKLIDLFPEDKHSLVAPMQLCNNGISAGGVHVFVDASNILIGFRDKLKELGMPALDLAFDCLALIMERRRFVGKRFLAGSSRASAPLPHIERFISTVKAIGYENHIFEQVQKRKEPTAGQKFFKDVKRMGWQEAQQRRSGEGSSSETDTTPSTPPALKWVEQGVDEILHLGMLQSVLDAEQPGVMVLATGDGQQAEYSDGFPAHAERALRKGWKVELVSWRQQTSAAYRNKAFVKKWGDRFRILYLDEFVEFLVES